jgi:hypothetical protein
MKHTAAACAARLFAVLLALALTEATSWAPSAAAQFQSGSSITGNVFDPTRNGKRYKEAIGELELYLKATPDARDAEKIKALISQLRSKAN